MTAFTWPKALTDPDPNANYTTTVFRETGLGLKGMVILAGHGGCHPDYLGATFFGGGGQLEKRKLPLSININSL